ncbi:hypothetical protein K435DRAFT_859820 [Dendrothele bispora CBS 962.96]|uniref:Uncharacterized protein n=1 Tax=Dendrothele bispora (strain CBS 962.96) TaxID=1314807 RepID=A0A4S8LZL4_DENBC|nr:hypothetical protein K435DRAFT_859820 [Dendrothele bispora CBS 962.96]
MSCKTALVWAVFGSQGRSPGMLIGLDNCGCLLYCDYLLIAHVPALPPTRFVNHRLLDVSSMFISKNLLPSSPSLPSCSRFWASTCFGRIGTVFGIMGFGIMLKAVTLGAFFSCVFAFAPATRFLQPTKPVPHSMMVTNGCRRFARGFTYAQVSWAKLYSTMYYWNFFTGLVHFSAQPTCVGLPRRFIHALIFIFLLIYGLDNAQQYGNNELGSVDVNLDVDVDGTNGPACWADDGWNCGWDDENDVL